MDTPSLTDAVRRELLAHPEVTEGPHRFGGVVFRLGGCELGHLHGETVADLPLSPGFRDELVASGRVSADAVVSGSGWMSRRAHSAADVADIVELFRMSYEHAAARPALASEEQDQEEPAPDPDGEPRPTWRDTWASRSRRIARFRNGGR